LTQHIDYERINEVSELLKTIGVEGVIKLEDTLDPQFKALKRISRVIGKNYACIYALLVALVSYKLTMRGEEWWECLAEVIESRRLYNPLNSLSDVLSDVLWFIDNCRGAAIAREARKSRVVKAFRELRGFLDSIVSDYSYVYRDPQGFLRLISRALGAEEWRKTIAFTVKMVYYATRDPGEVKTINLNIPIPVDSRVACATFSSMIVKTRSYRDLIVNPRLAQEAWSIVSRETGIPTLNLDTLLWLTGWAPRDLSLEDARRVVANILSSIIGEDNAYKISSKLYIVKCT